MKFSWLRVIGWTSACLLVIAIPALFPVSFYNGHKEHARRIVCASNMKQMGLAFYQYSQDNDLRMPPSATWADVTYPYEKTSFRCPSVYAGSGYAYNSKLDCIKITTSPDPTTVISIFESTSTVANANDMLNSLCTPGRHSGGNNYLFLDGHVRYYDKLPNL